MQANKKLRILPSKREVAREKGWFFERSLKKQEVS
jgi:hypothetical protein